MATQSNRISCAVAAGGLSLGAMVGPVQRGRALPRGATATEPGASHGSAGMHGTTDNSTQGDPLQ